MDVPYKYINALLSNIQWMNDKVRDSLDDDVRTMLHDAISSHIMMIKDMLDKLPTEY